MKLAEPEMEIRVTREDETPGLVKFGNGRTVIEFKYNHKTHSKSRGEGYDDPEEFFAPQKWWAHDYKTQRDAGQFEGVPWIDLRQAVETSEGYRLCVKGPMCDVDLKEGEVDWLCEPNPLMETAMVESGNQYGALLVMQRASRMANGKRVPGPLDSVDVVTFCRLWKAVGAKVGRIRGGQFVEEEF